MSRLMAARQGRRNSMTHVSMLDRKFPLDFTDPGMWCGTGIGKSSECEGIQIHSKALPDTQKVVLLHEIIHIINSSLGVRDQITDQQDELICNAVSSGMLSFLRNNPEIVAWIQSRADEELNNSRPAGKKE
jgi:hypothetical protein